MNLYIVTILVKGLYSYEPSNCPSDWKRSGCYDVTVECHRKVTYEVTARSRGEAFDLAGKESWKDDRTQDWLEIGCVFIESSPDYELAEAIPVKETPWQDGPAEIHNVGRFTSTLTRMTRRIALKMPFAVPAA